MFCTEDGKGGDRKRKSLSGKEAQGGRGGGKFSIWRRLKNVVQRQKPTRTTRWSCKGKKTIFQKVQEGGRGESCENRKKKKRG